MMASEVDKLFSKSTFLLLYHVGPTFYHSYFLEEVILNYLYLVNTYFSFTRVKQLKYLSHHHPLVCYYTYTHGVHNDYVAR